MSGIEVFKAGISVSVENNIQIIKFNNPKKKNAIQVKAYVVIKEALEKGAQDDKIAFTVFTGIGDYYSSGFDISDPDIFELNATELLKEMIDAFIDHPKLLISVVNGPAIGLAVTTLGLCDLVFASETATFVTPFSNLGLNVEGCASYTFPRIMGNLKANELLLIGRKMAAEEAQQFGLVSQVYKQSESSKIWEYITNFKKLSNRSIRVSKKIIKNFDRKKLHEANIIELENLKECFESDELVENIMKFIKIKNKL